MIGITPPQGVPLNSLLRRDSSVVSTIPLRLASWGVTTDPDDVLPDLAVEGRVAPFSVSRGIGGASWGGYAGSAPLSLGNLDIVNGDGSLSDWPDRFGVDGRKATLRAGVVRRDDSGRATVIPIRDFELVCEARTGGWSTDGNVLRLQVGDMAGELNRPIQTQVYRGLGGLEGGEDLVGTSKPMVFGRCYGVPLVLIDAARLIYQIHDGPMMAIDKVYDGGLNLAFDSAVNSYELLEQVNPEPGSYVTCPNRGCVRLGGAPASALRADVRGDGVDPNYSATRPWSNGRTWSNGRMWRAGDDNRPYVETAAQIIYRLATERTGWGSNRADVGSFKTFDQIQPAPIGYYVAAGSAETIATAVSTIAESMGGWCGTNRQGQFQIGRLESPFGQSAYKLRIADVVNFEAMDLPWVAPFYRHDIAYARMWEPLRDSEILEAVSDTRRAFISQDVRRVAVASSRQRVKRPSSSVARDSNGFFVNDGDALQEAARRNSLYRKARTWRAEIKGKWLTLELGQQVGIERKDAPGTYRQLMIVGITIDGAQRQTTLTLFG